ncbi:PAS domain-containing sensor histidine kinase, partial [Lysobacter sp. 2RAB21]
METRLPPGLAPVSPADADLALRRELYFFTLYRLLEAALLVLFLFGPIDNMIAAPRHDLFARSLSLSYLFIATLLFVFGRRGELRSQVLAGIACDLFFGILAIHALPGAGTGIALMLMFNVGAAALLLRARYGIGAAIVACLGLIGEWLWTELGNESTGRTIAEPIMFALGYLSIALLTNMLGRQMRESQELAERRGAEAANYAEINELIIRRMRTGVLLVDGEGRLR